MPQSMLFRYLPLPQPPPSYARPPHNLNTQLYLDTKKPEKTPAQSGLQNESSEEWLSAPGPYRNLIKDLFASDPRLRQQDPRKGRQRNIYPSATRPPNVLAMQLRADGTWGDPIHLYEGSALDQHLTNVASRKATVQRWVYILEGLGPDFVRSFGTHFNLHPGMFVDQERVTVFDNHPRIGENDCAPLPSTLCTRGHILLKYYETLYLFPKPLSYRIYCATTGRQIAASRASGEFSDVGIARRKISFWSQLGQGGNWNCLIMCDPQIRQVGALDKPTTNFWTVRCVPFQGGYRDFIPNEEQMRARVGPPRTSTQDDLAFYIRTHSHLIQGLESDPSKLRIFVAKLVASHYSQLAEYLMSTFSVIQRCYQRRADFDDDSMFSVGMVESRWSEMQTWLRRMGEYCSNVTTTMIQLRIPIVEYPDPSIPIDWTDIQLDYQALFMKFRELRHRAEGLNQAATGLTGIAGNRQSTRDQARSIEAAKSTKVLALMGLIFIPMAFTAALMSMTEDFLPGGSKFWIYWVVSMSLVVVVIVSYYVLDRGYGDVITGWSSRRVLRNLGHCRFFRGKRKENCEGTMA